MGGAVLFGIARSARSWDDLLYSRLMLRVVFLQVCQEVVQDLLMVS